LSFIRKQERSITINSEEFLMSRSVKSSVLAAVVVGVASLNANAAFNYDLRFAPAGNPTAADATGHIVTNPSLGNYTLQLWGQITGDTTLNNDSWTAGWLSVASNGSGITGGITGFTLGSNFPVNQGSQVGAAADISADGIGDWGSASGASTTNWILWQNTTPIVGGTAGAESQAVAGTNNGWEVLLGTFTVSVTGKGSGTCEFDPIVASGTAFGTTGTKKKPLIAVNDTATINAATAGLGAQFVVGGGVVTPEPASLAMLGLGSLALLARRRK